MDNPAPASEVRAGQVAALLQQLQALLGNGDSLTVNDVVTRYLASPRRICARVVAHQDYYLKCFARAYGDRPAAALKRQDLRDFIHAYPAWRSRETERSIAAIVKRCFAWAMDAEIIFRHPFARLTFLRGDPRRPMTAAEFKTAMRYSSPDFRRVLFFLKWTGCRPCEMSSLRWQDVDFERSIARLQDHKTKDKIGRPRFLLLLPAVVRLLRWLQRRSEKSTSETWLFNLLKNGPVAIRQVARRARHRGLTYRQMQFIRKRVGARTAWMGKGDKGKRVYLLPLGHKAPLTPAMRALVDILRVGATVPALDVLAAMRARGFHQRHTWAAAHALGVVRKRPRKRFKIYYLPEGTEPPVAEREHVFLNADNQPWQRSALGLRLHRLKRKGYLPAGCFLYGLRHAWCSELILSGMNFKLVSLALGHTSVAMTEHYASYLGSNTDELHAALREAMQQRNGAKGGAA